MSRRAKEPSISNHGAEPVRGAAADSPLTLGLLLIAAIAIPATLLWDFSWESTIGIDLVWAPPHTANYAAVALAGFAALGAIVAATRAGSGVRIVRWHGPIGAWIVLWGALAFAVAVLFDRWWAAAYGLAAGIWHPPQILKAVAFFAILLGVWLVAAIRQERTVRALAFASAGAAMLAMITVVTLPLTTANRQHAAMFYLAACGTYPIVLAALASAGRVRFPATIAAAVFMLIVCALIWILPLFPARPQVGPIYNPRDTLLPPPFPVLLVLPALALDLLLRFCREQKRRGGAWITAAIAGLAFFAVFLAVQWFFAPFLLSPAADNWFFAGGGQHWPFYIRILPELKTAFWNLPGDDLTAGRVIFAAVLAIAAARLGLWLGAWMTALRR